MGLAAFRLASVEELLATTDISPFWKRLVPLVTYTLVRPATVTQSTTELNQGALQRRATSVVGVAT